MNDGISDDDLFPPLLHEQQFTAADALAVSGLSSGQLKGILDRGQIMLSVNHNPGTGRRRMFTGQDILSLAVVQAAGRVGFPLRWGNVLSQKVINEAGRMRLSKDTRHISLACYPANEGEDWAFIPVIDGQAVSALPTAFQMIDVTREITQTIAKLKSIVKEETMPDFSAPQPPKHVDNPYAPHSNLMKLWEKDASGSWRYVGLTLDETRILMAHEGIGLDGDDLTYFEGVPNDDRELIVSLMNRRESARFSVIGGESD